MHKYEGLSACDLTPIPIGRFLQIALTTGLSQPIEIDSQIRNAPRVLVRSLFFHGFTKRESESAWLFLMDMGE